MKIALFSDIHANLPALEAFFKHVEEQNIDALYCLGDLVGYNVWPNEVINEIRKRYIPTIAGNYDYGIGRMSNECGCAYKTNEDKDNGAKSIAFTNAAILPNERNYLKNLPAHIRLEFQGNHQKFNILMVHGSPRKINEYLFEDREEKSFLRVLEDANADILCFGHTHKPFHRKLSYTHNQQTFYRHAINIGSIGKPKDNNPMGCYVILEISDQTNMNDVESIKVSFMRFGYDIDQSARAIEQSQLPHEYADMLRYGY